MGVQFSLVLENPRFQTSKIVIQQPRLFPEVNAIAEKVRFEAHSGPSSGLSLTSGHDPKATFGARERTGEIEQNSVTWRLADGPIAGTPRSTHTWTGTC